jgi:hypothetical protein
MSQAILFVRFKDQEKAKTKGFIPTYSYPVFHVDVGEIEGNEQLEASFLIANNEGEFLWVSQSEVIRSSGQNGQKRENRRHNGHNGHRQERNPMYSGLVLHAEFVN